MQLPSSRPASLSKGASILRPSAFAFLLLCASLISAQPVDSSALSNRLSAAAPRAEQVELPRTATSRAATSTPLGRLSPDTTLQSMRLVLQPSAAQKADLSQLLADQNNPRSPQFHAWLSPAQFATRFGVSDADLAVLQQWLMAQGFTVESVTPARTAILFSGSSATVESAFGTTLQRYHRDGQDFFENSGNLHIPAAFSGVVAGVANLSSYRWKSYSVKPAAALNTQSSSAPRPEYASPGGNQFLTPNDFQQIYGLSSLIGSGFNGNGVTIVVAGQSAVNTTQLGYFQALTGQTQKMPAMMLVPNTGISASVAGDEGESEIDLEYAGGTAPAANILFVYTGNNSTASVFNSVLYAIDNKLAPIISLSYGACETSIGGSDLATLEYALQQANVQGQTIVASSGDTDAATCDASSSGGFTSAINGATVSYPASSAFVTGIGGTELTDNGNPSLYFSSTNNSQKGSALGYIPETAWNDTALIAQHGQPSVQGTGGGASATFGKPDWQTGPGVPADGRRDVPDISFAASPNVHGYIYCSGEPAAAGAPSEACSQTSFSTNPNGALPIVGGTSLSAPNFAAMLAIIEEANGTTNGLGNINPLLYATAAGAAGSKAFNDITVGNNFVACTTGYPDCVNGQLGYSTTPGYDRVTGLGSINGPAFVSAIHATPAAPSQTTVIVSTVPSTANTGFQAPAPTTTFSVAATVTGNSSVAPTGNVAFSIDGVSRGSATLASTAGTGTTAGTSPNAVLAITGGLAVGTHTITAAYAGDANYAANTSSLSVTIVAPAVGNFSIAATPSMVSVASGNSVQENLLLTSSNQFADIVNFDKGVSLSGTNAGNFPGCYSLIKVPVSANGTATAVITLYTTQAQCSNKGSLKPFIPLPGATTSAAVQPKAPRTFGVVAFAGLLLGCFGLRRSRRIVSLLAVLLTFGALSLSGCGSSSAPLTTAPTSGSGTYTITVVGVSASNPNITASTTFTLTIQ